MALSSTGNAEFTHSMTRTDNGPDLSDIQARLDAGDPALDPLGDLGPLDDLPRDRSRSTALPAEPRRNGDGPAVRASGGRRHRHLPHSAAARPGSTASRPSMASRANPTSIATAWRGAVNLDLPITKRSSAIGRLTANANGSVTRLSDFGTLTTLGAGLNWSPAQRLNLTASWTREEGPPSLQQLGDPLIETPDVSVFDFATGQTVLVTTLTGGNPDLRADTRNVLKIGGHWQPFEKTDLRLRAEYVRQTIDDPQASFPAASEALEAAFPERFTRDSGGTLVAVDLRPVNFQEVAPRHVPLGLRFHQAAAIEAAVAASDRRFPRAVCCAATGSRVNRRPRRRLSGKAKGAGRRTGNAAGSAASAVAGSAAAGKAAG